MQRLVFLCGDNTYVGPYAERRARALGLGSISFRLRATAGAGVPAAAAAAASERGVGLAGIVRACLPLTPSSRVTC